MLSARVLDLLLLADSLDIWNNLQDIPNHIETIMKNAIAFLIAICFSIGVILAIVGAIQWATGWDDRGGKKTVVKGVVLIGISLISGGLGIGIAAIS